MFKICGKKFKELAIDEEFWDYTEPPGHGDLFIKISETTSRHKKNLYLVDWKPEDIVEIEIL